jgi:hypothetical protein
VKRARRANWTRVLTAVAVIMSAFALIASVSGPALAAPGRDGRAIVGLSGSAVAAARMQAATSSSKPCVVSIGAPKCQSTDPGLRIDWTSNGDTSGCGFTWSIDWDDGTKPQRATVSGESESGTYPLAGHAYGSVASRTFHITTSPVSVTGDCTSGSGAETFTLIVAPCTADDVHSVTRSEPSSAPRAPLAPAKARYFYASAYQWAEADGAQGHFRVAEPKVAKGECHSLAELAVESKDGKQIVEVGWTVDPGLFGGSTAPHLFVFYWVNGKEAPCYDECSGGGFVPTSKLAGSEVGPGTEADLSIVYSRGRWDIVEDNLITIGYYPESLWQKAHVSFTKVVLTQWFGEVATGPSVTRPCSQMGTGKFPSAGASAGEITDMGLIGGPRVELSTLAPNPDFYKVERAPDKADANAVRFGGPGECSG